MRIRLALAATLLAGSLAAAPARADHPEIVQVSRGDTTGNDATAYAAFGGVSADGARVWFTTADALLPEDTDNLNDVYERAGNALTLVSVPEGGPYGGASASGFVRASADGTSVVFGSNEQMTADDDDGNSGDWFLRRDGHTYLISKPDPDAFVLLQAAPLTGQITPDGTRVFFASLEDLSPNDSNFQVDLYEWDLEDQTARPVSVKPSGSTHSSGAGLNVVAVASADGTRAFWTTRGALVPEDADSTEDVYMRENGETTLVTTTTSADPGDTTMRQISADGRHVFFQTTEALVPEDTDTTRDVYEVIPGGDSQLVSIGTQAGSPEDADFQRTSADGLSVWFTTLEQLTPDDTDANQDIYLRHDGQTTLETQGPTGGNTGFDDIVFSGIAADGSRMYFTTHEALTADDQDPAVDIYERHAGVTRRVSIGAPGYDNGFTDASFAAASPDGARIVYQAEDPMSDSDTDFSDDLYEVLGDTVRLLTGGSENAGEIYGGASADASRVFFTTTERLNAFDTDDQPDVYESRMNRAASVATSAAGSRVAGDPAAPADAAVAVDDPENDALQGATVLLAGALDDAETLGFTDGGAIHGALAADGRTLTLSGTAPRAAYEAALRSVTYGGGATPGARSVSFTVSDGFDTSAPATRTLVVTAPPPGGPAGHAGADNPSAPPAPSANAAEPEPGLSTSTPADVVVSGDTIKVGCRLSSGTLESCEADARAGSMAARLVSVGHGRADFAGGRSGTVRIRLTPAGLKLLRARNRASRLILSIAAHPRGAGDVLRDRRSVRVLLAGTTLHPAGHFRTRSAQLRASTRASLRRFARDLRSARTVQCTAGTVRSERRALGLRRARAACAYLRGLGVRAKLRSSTVHRLGRRVALRVSG